MSKQLILKVQIPQNVEEDHLKGLLLSFVTAVDEVSQGLRKASYLNQFYKVRLNKLDRRLLSGVLGQFQKQLGQVRESVLLESLSSSSGDVPKEFLAVLDLFSNPKRRTFDFGGAPSPSSGPLVGWAIEQKKPFNLTETEKKR